MAHEDMVDKLDAAFQSGDIPDIYMERGGGELADHVEAGLVRDISDDAADEIDKIGGSVAGWQVDGKTYALPFSLGVVGVWYNKDLFEQAGITAPPTTMDELYDDIAKLKDAGITPDLGRRRRQVAGRALLVLHRAAVLPRGRAQGRRHQPRLLRPVLRARPARTVEDLLATEAVQRGLPDHPAQEGATSASGLLATGKVAMEMQGHWEPGVMQGLTDDGKGLGDKTGWFPFPAVEGGAGRPDRRRSAAATRGRSPRRRPTRRSTSSSTCSPTRSRRASPRTTWACRPTRPPAARCQDPALAELLKVRDARAVRPALLRHRVRCVGRRRDERRDRAAVRRRGVARRTSSTPPSRPRTRRSELTVTDQGAAAPAAPDSAMQAVARRGRARRVARRPVGAGMAAAAGDRVLRRRRRWR